MKDYTELEIDLLYYSNDDTSSGSETSSLHNSHYIYMKYLSRMVGSKIFKYERINYIP